MGWYKAGTVTLAQGSKTVVGAGTDFVSNIDAGFCFWGPDDRAYEVEAVVSATQLTLASNYRGASGNGLGYGIWQTQGMVVELSRRAADLLSSFGSTRDAVPGLQNSVTSLLNSVGALNDGVAVLKTDVTGLKADVNGLRTTASGVANSISAVANDVSTVRASVAALTSKLYGPTFAAYQGSQQILATGTWTKLTLSTEDYDMPGCFDGGRFAPNVAGVYSLQASVSNTNSPTTQTALALYLNGVLYRLLSNSPATTFVSGGASVMLDGVSDYVELYAYFGAGQQVAMGRVNTYFCGNLERPL